jgi:hypothetical protein
MTIPSDIQVLLRLYTYTFQRLQCWYYRWEEFVKYTVDFSIGGMIRITGFVMIGSGIPMILRLLSQQFQSS